MLNKNNKLREFAHQALDIYSDDTYAKLLDREQGNKEGTRASATLNNTAIRQASLMATGLAEFIAQSTELEVSSNIDAETVAGYIAQSVNHSSTQGDMTKKVFATINPGEGYVDKSQDSLKLGGKEASLWATKDDLNNAIGQINALLDDINGEVI